MTEKKPWRKPSITIHRVGLSNKFGATRFQHFIGDVDGVSIADLVEAHGSPLFVLSEQRLRENVRRVRRAFAARYPQVRFGWSYKTNYLDAVCAVMHQEGSWAEVVSEFEYRKARRLGVPGDRIIFNGPHKTHEALERAVAEGATINIDHLDELYMLESVARAAKRRVPVGLRLNFDTGFAEVWSRFGFNLESGQAMDAARRIGASAHLELIGLHAHLGTFILDSRAYTAQVRIMAGFMDQVEAETGCEIRFLDLGGGFASLNALQGIYLPPEQVTPTPEQYAEAICPALLAATQEREARGKHRPVLILETGRALVDSAEVLVTTVTANKRLADGRRATILDAGVNILFTAFWYNHAVSPTRPMEGLTEETVLYGPLCMNIDVVRHSIPLPPLDVGERLVVSHVGAYNNTQWLQFIEMRPAIVMVAADQTVHEIRQPESMDILTALERLPERLSGPLAEKIGQ